MSVLLLCELNQLLLSLLIRFPLLVLLLNFLHAFLIHLGETLHVSDLLIKVILLTVIMILVIFLLRLNYFLVLPFLMNIYSTIQYFYKTVDALVLVHIYLNSNYNGNCITKELLSS